MVKSSHIHDRLIAALAQVSGYSILGCETEMRGGELVVTLSQGTVVTTEFRCMDGLNDLATVCQIVQEEQFSTHANQVQALDAIRRTVSDQATI
jgi:hypothetical protein